MVCGKNKKKTYIIAITSGLGNQLFQYSLYIYLKSKGYICFAYPFSKYLGEHNGFELEKLFGNRIKLKKRSIFWDKFIEYYFGWRPRLKRVAEIINYSWIYNLFNLFPYKLIVFPSWGDYTFIKDITDIIYDTYIFNSSNNPLNKEILQEIKNSESVSIHIRRGDYQKEDKWRLLHGDVCDINYYERAIKLVQENHPQCKFFIFSDDIPWARENLSLKNAKFIDWNSGDESYMDLVLMSNCKHNILSNSTFSLWGAWLNKNPDKEVIVPKKWRNIYNDQTYSIFIDSNWCIVDNSRPNISIIVGRNIILNEQNCRHIMNQSYSDHELIVNEPVACSDARIKFGVNPSGNFIIDIKTHEELREYKNRHYLRDKLIQCYGGRQV